MGTEGQHSDARNHPNPSFEKEGLDKLVSPGPVEGPLDPFGIARKGSRSLVDENSEHAHKLVILGDGGVSEWQK